MSGLHDLRKNMGQTSCHHDDRAFYDLTNEVRTASLPPPWPRSSQLFTVTHMTCAPQKYDSVCLQWAGQVFCQRI